MMIHCRKATELLSAAQDRPLATSERFALRLHLALCRHCRTFSRQLDLLRDASGRWKQQQNDLPGDP